MAFSAVYDTATGNALVAIGSVVGQNLPATFVVIPCAFSDATPAGSAPDLGRYQWNPSLLRFDLRPAVVPGVVIDTATTLMGKAPGTWTPTDQINALRVLMFYVLGQFK